MNRDEILEIADGMSNTTIIMPKNEDLIAFAEAIIQHYKDSLLKDVGEPVGYLRTTEKALVFMPLTHVKDGEYFFTESQLIAAVAKKDEEIERLNRQVDNFNELDRKLEAKASMDLTSMPDAICELSQQLKAAQEDITEMRADHLMLVEENHALREQLATAEQRVAEACYRALDEAYGNEYQLKAIGEYRKYMKEV